MRMYHSPDTLQNKCQFLKLAVSVNYLAMPLIPLCSLFLWFLFVCLVFLMKCAFLAYKLDVQYIVY